MPEKPEAKLIPIGQLQVWAKNPRTITDKRIQRLCDSLKADPDLL